MDAICARRSGPDPPLIARILEATEQPGALDAFTSIVLSPKASNTFDELLEQLACPVCLLYGETRQPYSHTRT